MLWLGIHFHLLPLEVYSRSLDRGQAFAVCEHQRVLAANTAAREQGVESGLKLNAAQALSPNLLLRDRAPGQEDSMLRRLAAWALQFTSLVSLRPPNGLLLEIGASLRLLGGLDTLTRSVETGIKALGHQARLGIAPTPGAAWLLARAGITNPVLELRHLPDRLAVLPVDLLDLTDKQKTALNGLGVRTLGECLQLPRKGLARRLGRDLPENLDRALGRDNDPRTPFLPPPRFRSGLELPAEAHDTDALLFAAHRLFLELAGLLRGLDGGIQRLRLALRHPRHPTTQVELGLLAPSRDADHLMRLLRERLERVELPEPVRHIELRAGRIERFSPAPADLLDESLQHLEEHWDLLVERIVARLGEDAVTGLGCVPEHRPERAWALVKPGSGTAQAGNINRPLWLLPTPLELRQKHSQPVWRGPLVLHQGPERIETGWWDGNDVCRDYYVAQNPGGERLWIFQERRRRLWYLHGLFG